MRCSKFQFLHHKACRPNHFRPQQSSERYKSYRQPRRGKKMTTHRNLAAMEKQAPMTVGRKLRKTRSAKDRRRSRKFNTESIDANAKKCFTAVNCARPEKSGATKQNPPADGVQVMEDFASTEKENGREFVRHMKLISRRRLTGWKPCYIC